MLQPLILAHVLLAVQPVVADDRTGTTILVDGEHIEAGRPVVLPGHKRGFDAMQLECESPKPNDPCCNLAQRRKHYREDKTRSGRLRESVTQIVLHHSAGCANATATFAAMQNSCRPLSAHFIIDLDGMIYQTLDLKFVANHATVANERSIGIEIVNAADATVGSKVFRAFGGRPEYMYRQTKPVTVNGGNYCAFEFTEPQYSSIVALIKVLRRTFPRISAGPQEFADFLHRGSHDLRKVTGILGHYHVQANKWDPAGLDLPRVLRALGDVYFPVPVRGYERLTKIGREWLTAAAHDGADSAGTGFFPVSPGRLWHSGVHMAAQEGTPVRSPAPGTIVAARVDRSADHSTSKSFVLLDNEVELGRKTLHFFTLLAHLSDDVRGELPHWERALSEDKQAALRDGQIVQPRVHVEAGDVVGSVGTLRRGPEAGHEIHFEIFTTKEVEAFNGLIDVVPADDQPLVRVEALIGRIDSDKDGQLSATEVRTFFRDKHGDAPALRRSLHFTAFRHVHEWSGHPDGLPKAPELENMNSDERRNLTSTMLDDYVFMPWGSSPLPGLRGDGVVISYDPITFLSLLVAAGHEGLPDRYKPLSRFSRAPQTTTREEHAHEFLTPQEVSEKQRLMPPMIPEAVVPPKATNIEYSLIEPDDVAEAAVTRPPPPPDGVCSKRRR